MLEDPVEAGRGEIYERREGSAVEVLLRVHAHVG
jgi:hypothetical protein